MDWFLLLPLVVLGLLILFVIAQEEDSTAKKAESTQKNDLIFYNLLRQRIKSSLENNNLITYKDLESIFLSVEKDFLKTVVEQQQKSDGSFQDLLNRRTRSFEIPSYSSFQYLEMCKGILGEFVSNGELCSEQLDLLKDIINEKSIEFPYLNLPDSEKNILIDLKKFTFLNDNESINRKIDELHILLNEKNLQIKRGEKVKSWSFMLTLFGLVIAIIPGMVLVFRFLMALYRLLGQ